ncbi:MAG TPA: serine/threonine-protein kinase [Terriglobales bacterium]|nr:serine/threonine-protein kinase [Terriglobales bacterium]
MDRSPSSPVPPSPPSSSSSRSSASLRAESGRILPGTLLADRYRIVALIGRGGMGEVYRAEDLKLDQDVALKFLPEKLVQDGVALARFHREVRIAREISHPNVCRVFDIGEANGVPFISMEYVDGEDLSTLLRRIGRLPQDKAIDISRQLCAGLAIAHDHGVLHRDLKPANVMLDDRGKVRIMDFGLAGVATDIQGQEISSGTPAYMAPEQLTGKEVTILSDIYSLGLVLYEVFTGKRAFEASNLNDLLRLREHSSVTNPSHVVHDLDPLVERVILRCLEADSVKRPKTALQVAAALPGGDPLAAALAAGETPSPQMVAAAGGENALAPRVAWSFLALALIGFIAVLWVARYSTDLALYPVEKSPEVLEDHAREIAVKAGYTQARDHAFGFKRNYAYLLYRNARKMSSPHGEPISGSNPGALAFNYRQSPEVLIPHNAGSQVQLDDPPYETSGMVLVSLDSLGRLRFFRAVPSQDESLSSALEPNWQEMFQQAGLDLNRFASAPAKWLPDEPFDRQRDWEGTYEGDNTPIHVSAASYHGKPVHFQVITPWTKAADWTPQRSTSRTGTIAVLTVATGGVFLILAAVIFARKNVRLGRGDRKGAFRLAAFYFLASCTARILLAHHVADTNAELSLLVVPGALALLVAVMIWGYYIALEPYVRRRWPEYLISWTRLLGGNYRDAMVGRDLLAGCLIGCCLALVEHVINALPAWFNLAGQTPINGDGAILGTTAKFLGMLLFAGIGGIFFSLTILFLFFLVRAVTRNYWGSILVIGLLLTLINLGRENVIAETLGAVLLAVLGLLALLRFGLLALIAAVSVQNMLQVFPVALDPSRWYFARGFVPAMIVLALTIYGFRTSLGGRPVFRVLTDDQ